MDQVLPSQSSAAGLLEPDSEELQLRVESFRKLGYSSEEVRSALRKLGLSTDTNSVLGELVRSNASSAPCVSVFEGDERSTGQKDALLPPSWTLGPRNVPQPSHQQNVETELRPVVIDGSNVAMSHGNKEVFSCHGIQLAVNFFLERGHNSITVFVPSWRKELPRPDAPITDQHILTELEKRKIVVFTPSRRVGGKRVVCYDDRFIVKLAYELDGVIISNDTYRDLQGERPEWKKCIEERLLMYSFVNDKFMPPDDPLGRHGPSLNNFLRKNPLPPEQKRQLCPYDKKCTYGMKCKFYHPERVNQPYLSLADELREKAQISTSKDEKRVLANQGQPDTGHAPHPPDAPAEISRNGLHPGHIVDNHPLYREDPGKGSSHLPPAGQSQKDWSHLMPSLYYPNMSQEYLDSGFGSFESQYSDHSHYKGNPPRVRSQQQAMHVGKNGGGGGGPSCFSQQVPNAALQQHHRKWESERQPNYPQIYPPGAPHHHSLSGPLHYTGVSQQNYWSDPFQGLSSSQPRSSLTAHEFHSWGHQPPSGDPRRMELRKKLQAIFNPQEVDRVMELFPHLMDAEKLAAKILNMKTQRGIF